MSTKKEIKAACAEMIRRMVDQGFGAGYGQMCAARTFSEFYDLPYEQVLKIAKGIRLKI